MIGYSQLDKIVMQGCQRIDQAVEAVCAKYQAPYLFPVEYPPYKVSNVMFDLRSIENNFAINTNGQTIFKVNEKSIDYGESLKYPKGHSGRPRKEEIAC